MIAQHEYGAHWTSEQYLEMERASNVRHELIDGRVYAMAGGDQHHSRIGINVTAALADRLDEAGCQVFNSDMKVRLANEQDFLYPDAAITCDPRDLVDSTRDFICFPWLVVEVLSESTERYDRGAKFDLYRERGTLHEYVLIATDRRYVEVRRRGDTDAWTTDSYGSGDDVLLHSVSMSIPVDSLYRGVRI
jgi:Uma2 family endonuclease